MKINYVLISDGSSDSALIKIINFCLKKHFGDIVIAGQRADLYRVNRRPKTLVEKIRASIDYYEPGIIFIHRDAEKQLLETREEEINDAIKEIIIGEYKGKYIRVIPIKMMEAWLLTDEMAIRYASGNPNGTAKLDMPDIKKIEQLTDPKYTLKKLICDASELKGRRLKKLEMKLSAAIHLVAEYTEDFSPLSSLRAFQNFESQIAKLKE
jgi:hypothetical protein